MFKRSFMARYATSNRKKPSGVGGSARCSKFSSRALRAKQSTAESIDVIGVRARTFENLVKDLQMMPDFVSAYCDTRNDLIDGSSSDLPGAGDAP